MFVCLLILKISIKNMFNATVELKDLGMYNNKEGYMPKMRLGDGATARVVYYLRAAERGSIREQTDKRGW